MKRSINDDILKDSTESPNKKIKIDNDSIIKKFKCTEFYIDKSLIIKQFLDESSRVICVTGPSKCGKTTNLRMMQYFFELNYEDVNVKKNSDLFKNLKIAEKEKKNKKIIDIYQGQYPVVYLNFNLMSIDSTYDETINKFKNFIKDLYSYYNDKINPNDLNYREKTWNNYLNGDIEKKDIIYSIIFLCKSLQYLFKKEVILLIDNYDAPFLNAFNSNFYDKFYSFYKEFLESIFNNDNSYNYLFKTFITGKLDISFFDEFNLKNCFGLNNEYKEYFNISEPELRILLSKFKLNEEFNNFKSIFTIENNTNDENNKYEANIIFSSSNYNNNTNNDNRNNRF